MRKPILIISGQNPYPFIKGGIERLIVDFQIHYFNEYSCIFIFKRFGQNIIYTNGQLSNLTIEQIDKINFKFAVIINDDVDYSQDKFVQTLAKRIPTFLFIQTFPRQQYSSIYTGVLTHKIEKYSDEYIIEIPGSYDSSVYFKDRGQQKYVSVIARVSEQKRQLELVRQYKQKVYDRFKIPLLIVGGTFEADYAREVLKYVDNISTVCTLNWANPKEIAEILNSSRLFVMNTLSETFCIALLEALACGTTCVINGEYVSFGEAVRPYIYGNSNKSIGDTIDIIVEALDKNITIDASEWTKKNYSTKHVRQKILAFVENGISIFDKKLKTE